MKMAVRHLTLLLLVRSGECTQILRGGARSAAWVAGRTVGNSAANSSGVADRGGAHHGKASLEAKLGSMIGGLLAHGGGVTESLEASLGSMVMRFLKGQDATLRHIIEVVHDTMDFGDAVRRLEGKLPGEVKALVTLTGQRTAADAAKVKAKGKKAGGQFSEDSLQKARKILNSMIEGSWKDLDTVIIACKEFEEKNRETFSQVTTDIARLGSRIANFERKKVATNEGIAEQDRERGAVEDDLSQKTQAYELVRDQDKAEMVVRKNNLAVFSFILNMTRCSSTAFVQLVPFDPAQSPLSVCDTSDGLELEFNNPSVQAKFERLMTPGARLALREALGQVQEPALARAHMAVSFMGASRAGNKTHLVLPAVAETGTPVKEAPSGANWKKCSDGAPNCGLLHDTMSSQWGQFKDLVDGLQAKMDKDFDAFEQEKGNLNEQLTVLSGGKKQNMESLAETISNMNLDTQERMEKDEQHRQLEREYKKEMAQCRAQIEEILFTNICAVRKVRNEVMKSSSLSPPSNMTDCDVKDWVAGSCSVDCDDTCPRTDSNACGGTQTLSREIVVAPNQYGAQCPALRAAKKCGQFSCPVNCKMSEWSGWSKCTKECEGGVQGKTRSILVKPRNGGDECDTVQEMRACNTGSCDRDCTLVPWTEWSPCSNACGGGTQARARKVSIPIRGQGKCPAQKNAARWEEKACNVQKCVGDEVCIAKQDLLILLDASGSLQERGYEIVRSFAANLTLSYKTAYYGVPAMQVGAVLFGNGRLRPDGSIEPAISVAGLTSDMAALKKAIEATKWQRGFTNMAQAFVLADTMLQQGGRSDAQSGLLVISDGTYSFEFETAQKVKELKDKNVNIFMAPISSFSGSKEIATIKEWASFPCETNYELIPGLGALEFNQEAFIAKLVAKSCSDSVSPSMAQARDEAAQYMLIHEHGTPSTPCAPSTKVGVVASVDACADAARARNKTAFSFGHGISNGECLIEAMTFTQEWYQQHLTHRENVPCPNGNWTPNPYFETYAVQPH